MKGKTIGIIVIVIVLIIGGWYLLSNNPANAPATTTEQSQTPVPDTKNTTTVAPATTQASPASVTIAYTNQGFSPKSVTVPADTTVIFVNQTGENMWVASAPHPTHQAYDGTAVREHCAAGYRGPAPFDQCASGDNFSFTFLKTGEWKYHNHADAADFGTIIVTGNAAAPSAL